jgi:hypothetical protein
VPAFVAWPVARCAYLGCTFQRFVDHNRGYQIRRWCFQHCRERELEIEEAGPAPVSQLVEESVLKSDQ